MFTLSVPLIIQNPQSGQYSSFWKRKQHIKLQNLLTTTKNELVIVLLTWDPGPKVIKLFPCATQMSMTLFLLINVEMPRTVDIYINEQKNSIIGLSESKKVNLFTFLYL